MQDRSERRPALTELTKARVRWALMSTPELSVPVAQEDDPPGNGLSAAPGDASAAPGGVSAPPAPLHLEPTPITSVPPTPVPEIRGPDVPGPRAGKPGTERDRVNGAGVAAPVGPARMRQVQGTVRRIDLWSVFRVSALIYGSLLLVWLVAGAALWVVATITGARHNVEHFIASALLLRSFRFASLTILLSATGIGIVLTALVTGATVALAAFYNLASEVIGGFEVTVVQEEPAKPVV